MSARKLKSQTKTEMLAKFDEDSTKNDETNEESKIVKSNFLLLKSICARKSFTKIKIKLFVST